MGCVTMFYYGCGDKGYKINFNSLRRVGSSARFYEVLASICYATPTFYLYFFV